MSETIRMLFLNGDFLREDGDYRMIQGRPTLEFATRKGDQVDLHEFEDGLLVHVLYLECEEPTGRGEPLKAKIRREWEP